MKILSAAFAGCLFLVSTAVFINAQEDKNEGKPAAQEEPKPAVVKPEEAKPEKPAKEDRRAQEQSKDEKQTQNNDRKQETEANRNQQRNDQKAEENRAAGNKNGGNERASKQSAQRIPDDKFRAYFGREHHFRVSQPVVVEGRPRVQYSGYWFAFVDPWPVGWSYSDDCYIDYIDGEYFLFDLLHPATRIAVVVVL